MAYSTEILILGGGMVGLSIAHQILEKYPKISITVVDKEKVIGAHSSGRNSGVLHAGIYYPPNTVKARVCVKGSRRLRQWCEFEKIPILSCGKVIAPQALNLDSQLDLLKKRGCQNGAEVHLIDEKEFFKLVPDGRTASGRALWSPNTCVVKPKLVLERLRKRLEERNVKFIFDANFYDVDINNRCAKFLISKSRDQIHYGHLFNTTGLQADRISHKFQLAKDYTLLPFKGQYWKLDPRAPFNFTTNLYPVPDLNVPFLGVHVTPSPDGTVSFGPTAIPAWGRENYFGMQGFEPIMASQFLFDLAGQWIQNSGGFRQYAREQALHGIKPLFVKAAQALVPALKGEHLIPSEKVGIRAQLFDRKSGKLIQDFTLDHGLSSTHVLNAISPAFTASFELADLILEQSSLN